MMAARRLRRTAGHLCTVPPVEAAPVAAPPSGVVDLEHFEAHGWVTVPQAVGAEAVARLRARSAQLGTLVHPADLDAALQLSSLAATAGVVETRLPFAVDEALLRRVFGGE